MSALMLILASAMASVNASFSLPVVDNSSSITRLKFLPVDHAHERRRAPVPHKRRRRLDTLGGLELEGNLNTLGYFSAEVCVGSPPRSFDLIVDTGSALTAFPCSDCPHCGQHQHASSAGSRFDTRASSTAEVVSCTHPPSGMRCRSCDAGACGYGVSYTEGSSIRGKLVSDLFWFGHASGPKQVRGSFGCQTYESGLFYSQVADGISGFSQAETYGPTLFDYLRNALHTPDVFSICLSENVGAMVLGGTVPASLSAAWIPYSGGSSYTIALTDIKIAGRGVGAPASRYASTIVDSGTTFMYLPPDAYRPVYAHSPTPLPALPHAQHTPAPHVRRAAMAPLHAASPPHGSHACPNDLYNQARPFPKQLPVGCLRLAYGQGRVPRRLLLLDERRRARQALADDPPLCQRRERLLRPSPVRLRAPPRRLLPGCV